MGQCATYLHSESPLPRVRQNERGGSAGGGAL